MAPITARAAIALQSVTGARASPWPVGARPPATPVSAPGQESTVPCAGSAGSNQLALASHRRAGPGFRGGPDQPRRDARSSTCRLELHRRGYGAPTARLAASTPCSIRFATSHSTGTSRSIETTSTPCSNRSTPAARTTDRTASAPRPHHLRRRRPSHLACSTTRLSWRSLYVRLFVSIGIRRQSARSRPKRCPHRPANVGHDAAASPVPGAAPVCAAPRPPSEPRRRCAGRGTASGGHGGRASPRHQGAARLAEQARRSRGPVRAGRSRWRPAPTDRRATADGASGDGRSSSDHPQSRACADRPTRV
jgi:hypothetical protein